MLRLLVLFILFAAPICAATDEELEAEAWSLLREGMRSPSVVVRGYSLMASYFSQDAYGVELVAQALRDNHIGVRQQAAECAGRLRDEMLAERVMELLSSDPDRGVRLTAVRAVGEMRLAQARPQLERLLDGPRSTLAERSVAVQALSNMSKGITKEELGGLVRSPRKGLRLLAAALAVHFQPEGWEETLQPLLTDTIPDVRASAAAAFALDDKRELLAPLISDDHPVVSCAAAWACGQMPQRWLNDPNRATRLLAVASLAAQGESAAEPLSKLLRTHTDAYVRLNAAIGLVRMRRDLDAACTEIEKALTTLPDDWGMTEPTLFGPLFSAVAPSQLAQDGTPDFYVRLDLLNLLAILERPGAQAALRATLTQRRWGFAGSAAFSLLTEGDHSAVELLRPLLKDPDLHVRLQAAIVLMYWEQNPVAIQTLQEAYPGAERFLKERILEGLGGARTRDVLPFLAERMKEPFPTLRIIAASSVLNVMNH